MYRHFLTQVQNCMCFDTGAKINLDNRLTSHNLRTTRLNFHDLFLAQVQSHPHSIWHGSELILEFHCNRSRGIPHYYRLRDAYLSSPLDIPIPELQNQVTSAARNSQFTPRMLCPYAGSSKGPRNPEILKAQPGSFRMLKLISAWY